jgi:hypothetical protein
LNGPLRLRGLDKHRPSHGRLEQNLQSTARDLNTDSRDHVVAFEVFEPPERKSHIDVFIFDAVQFGLG